MRKCVICLKPSRSNLCSKHIKTYTYDKKYKLYRKKKRMDALIRYRDNSRRFHNTEKTLISTLKYLFGRKAVIESARPKWAISDKGALMEYDMAIPSIKTLIEFDGIQHFVYPNFFHKTKKQFNEQRYRDTLKEDLAKQHKWKLIRFKYDEYVDVELVKNKLKI